VTSAATTVLPGFPGPRQVRQVLANTDPDSSTSFEGQIRIPISAAVTGVPMSGRSSAAQTENATSQPSGRELDVAAIGFGDWQYLGLLRALVPAENVHIRIADDLAAASSTARFADAVLVTLAASRHLGMQTAAELEQGVESPVWLDELTSRIYRFSRLPQNWDSYGSRRISEGAIRKAVRIAGLLADVVSRSIVPLSERPFAAPSSSGGVVFEISGMDREVHIEVQNGPEEEYQVLRVWRDADGGEFERECNVRESELREVLSWVVRNS
jgi:hypothetical protein